MKRSCFLYLVVVLWLMGCGKENVQDSVICVKDITPSFGQPLISQQDLDTIHYLFEKNNIDYTDLQFFGLRTYTGTYKYSVGFYEYSKGIKLFGPNLGMWFYPDGSYAYSIQSRAYGVPLDTVRNMSLEEVGQFYKKIVKNDDTFIEGKEGILAGCFFATFGYYNLNVNNGGPKNFVKAWLVAPHDNEWARPALYINDVNSEILQYNR